MVCSKKTTKTSNSKQKYIKCGKSYQENEQWKREQNII